MLQSAPMMERNRCVKAHKFTHTAITLLLSFHVNAFLSISVINHSMDIENSYAHAVIYVTYA